MKRHNPDAIIGAPCFEFVESDHRVEGIGELAEHGSASIRRYGIEIILQSKHTSRIGVLAAREKIIRALRAHGAWVRNAVEPPSRWVYVIRLREDVRNEPGVARRNPGRDPLKDCFYVGETGLTPERRLQQHLTGKNASKWVRQFGLELAGAINPRDGEVMTVLEALRWERDLTRELRRKGYTVLGGH